MIRAKCKTWVGERGFGFVTPLDGGADIFCHFSAIADGDRLEPGEVVDVEYQVEDRGPRATRVVRVPAAEPAAEPATAPKPLPDNCYIRWDSPLDGWDRDRGRRAKGND